MTRRVPDENVPLPCYPRPTMMERALDLIFPPICVGCRRIGQWICSRCWHEVRWLLDRRCARCGAASATDPCTQCERPTSALTSIMAVSTFEGPGREAVHALKYHGLHGISGMMAHLMAQAAGHLEADAVIPVPLHPKRRRERGYDQSVLLGRGVAQHQHRIFARTALRRVRETQQQARLDADARHANVSNAFRSSRTWAGERVLLVDDVMTTGATLESAARALREAGIGTVYGLVFAHAL